MSKRIRWKKNPRATGLRAVGARPRGSILHDGEIKYASVYADRHDRWYWVAGWDSDVPYMNSCNDPVSSEQDAKRDAMAYVKAHMAKECSE